MKRLLLSIGLSVFVCNVFAAANNNDPCDEGGIYWNQYLNECRQDPVKAEEDWKRVCAYKHYIPSCSLNSK